MRLPLYAAVTAAFLVSPRGNAAGAAMKGDAPPHVAFHLSLFHPVSTNSDPRVSTAVALSLIQSRIGEQRVLGIHGIVSEVGGDARGLHLTGIYSRVGRDVRGISLNGLVGSVGGDVRGVQSSGILNFNDGGVRGAQFASIFNFNRGNVAGLQFAGLSNVSNGRTGFLQIAGVSNVSGGAMRGVQVAGMLNLAQADMHGLQIALGNGAIETHGAQIGLFNTAEEASGLQFGVWNAARAHHGVPVGMVNTSTTNGRLEILGFTSTLSAINIGVRTTVNRMSSMLTVGGFDVEGDVSTAAFVTWNYGVRFPLGTQWTLLTDLGFSHIMPQKSDDAADNDRLHWALLARALAETRLGENVSVFAGPGLMRVFDSYSHDAGGETKFLATAGVAVRP
jgi:hypothetical protein